MIYHRIADNMSETQVILSIGKDEFAKFDIMKEFLNFGVVDEKGLKDFFLG